MTADGFLAQKQRHPLAMTAAIAINVAAGTAVMLAKSGYVRIDPGTILTYPVPLPSPPPENGDRPKPKPHPQGKPEVWTPPPPIPTETSGRTEIAGTTDIGASIGDPGLPPIDLTRIEPPAKPPEPVTVGPEPDPRYAGNFQPPYPPQLLRTGIEGKAVVKVLIGTDGRVKQVAIVSADDPLFADASERQALRRWRFKPATRDGVPIESWKQMTVRFEIRA